jgi:MFS family permease
METENTTNSKQPLITPVLAWFMAAMVLANISGGMQGMMLPLYLTDLGASVPQVGLVFTISSMVPVVLQIFGGWVSDTLGRLRAVALGSIGGLVGNFIIVFSPSWAWVLVGISVVAIARSLVGPSFGAFIAEQSTEENRGKVYGITDTIFLIVDVVGPFLGGLLVDNYSFKTMLFIGASLYAAAAVMRILMARGESKTNGKGAQDLNFDSLKTNIKLMASMLVGGGILTWIFLTDGIRDIAYRMSGEFFPIYLEGSMGLTATEIGALGSFFGLAMMVVTIPAGWLADKVNDRVPIVIGFLMDAAGVYIFTHLDSYWEFAAMWIFFGFGIGLMSPAYNSLVSKAVPENMRGIAFGVFRSSLGLISMPAPFLGAKLWDRFGPIFLFRLTSLALAISAIPVWFKFKLPKAENGQAQTAGDPIPAD